ncbi:HAD family hydrolase [Aromatoleum toluclasticum]|uniref:HAD family hydrolase n=1 Tax=Aromatoleum toluclasticum TaxID=92003 RepID=UPI001D184F0E|nr:HAD-IA family hydrolase [Aromatoleum toluclasticum]MCC4118446.1 HAD family hydrolase [Aromatoleum toluclasticum]
MQRKIVFDAFGTLICRTRPRLNPYGRLLAGAGPATPRLPFLTRNVPIEVFAQELGLESLQPAIYQELAEDLTGYRLFEDVAPTLQRLRADGCRIVVCSNLAHPYAEVVRRLLPGLDGYIFSFQVGAKKPDPAIYRAVCETLDCRPNEALFVGDSQRADVDGPRRFGMSARLIDRRGRQTLDEVLRCEMN